ncbi:MAG: hypothetical protein JJE21_04185 [Spirochaetaceae bacterium]|nr:hypothetical protein [Spirochaetaceae bacterium]
MATEIELKAHVNDVDKILSSIRNTLGISQECFQEKKDIYLMNEIDKPVVRCRLEKKGLDKNNLKASLLITVKNKELSGKIEENNEFEIDSDAHNFETSIELFKALGYRETLLKEKTGYSFMLDKYQFPLHVEVLEVKPLGWFLEIEFSIKEQLSVFGVSALKDDLLDALALFGISQDKIEGKFYRDLLNQARLKTKGN